MSKGASFAAYVDALRLHVVCAAMTRHRGNITRVAAELKASRRMVRETLRDARLYPFPAGGTYAPADLDGLLVPPTPDAPGVTEDGTPGVVWWTQDWTPGLDTVLGVARLKRPTQAGASYVCELWQGILVSRNRALDYAARHGHAYRED